MPGTSQVASGREEPPKAGNRHGGRGRCLGTLQQAKIDACKSIVHFLPTLPLYFLGVMYVSSFLLGNIYDEKASIANKSLLYT